MIEYSGNDELIKRDVEKHNSRIIKNHAAQELKEMEDDIMLINAILVMARDKERAIKVTVYGPQKNKLSYWIDDNNNVVSMLESEKKLLIDAINELKRKEVSHG